MMKFFILLSLLALTSAFASSHNSSCEFYGMPGIDNQSTSSDPTKTEQRFNEIIDEIVSLFHPTILSLGGKLKIVRNWNSEIKNASANKFGKNWEMTFHGGYYRLNQVNDDFFAGTVCHELGHLLGGAPLKPFKEVSNEGQSDYWSTAVCLKEYFDKYPQQVSFNDPTLKAKCDERYDNSHEQNICYRIALYALKKANYFSVEDTEIKLPISTTTSQLLYTHHEHPKSQCRLETYVAGALCRPIYDPVASFKKLNNYAHGLPNNDYRDFLCEDLKDGKILYRDLRPSCWFNSNALDLKLEYDKKVKSKNTFGMMNSIAFHIVYTNYLLGKYTIKLTPSETTQRYGQLNKTERTVTREGTSETIASFKFKLRESINSIVEFDLVIIHDGKEIIKERLKVQVES